ncbi:MAG: hypothetical protein M9899_08115 [Bdellovibrionaceae bacterium]|nr:hypothetical protein [Pseudobdellovibrionaceae bacterium]
MNIFLGRDNTIMMYSAAQTTSDLPIKKVEWTYDGVTWEGWTFFPYLSESKGDTITVKVTNDDDEFVTQDLEIVYSDFCETQTRDNEFGFCLKSNNFSSNGDYIPLNLPFLNFYLSHTETLNGNLSNRKVYLVAESTGEAIDITSATSLSGANLVINMITLGSTLSLDDPADKFYIALYGDYGTVSATFDYENTNARSKSFKLGMSGLNLAFGEAANQLSVYSTSTPYGQVLTSGVGTSTVNLSYLPAGEYIIHVENATKEGYAQVYVNPEELVTVSFSMQPKDLSATGRQPLSDSYAVTRGSFLKSKIKMNSLTKKERLKKRLADLKQKYTDEYKKLNKNQKDDPISPLADMVYWNSYTHSSVDYFTQYTESMFINNYEMLKSQFLDPLPPSPLMSKPIKVATKGGQSKTFVSEYPAFPDPLVSVYNMKVQGTVPNGYVTLTNKNEDFGTSSGGVAVQAGKNYAPFMFGDLPILHISKSKEVLAIMYERCIIDAASDPVGISLCKFEKNMAEEAWKVLLDYLSLEATVRVRYTITGMYASQEHKIVHDHTYDYGTFVKENGDLYMAASKYIYSPEGTDINDGWLLGKQSYIYVPDYLTSPKVRLEMFTTIPDDIFDDLDIFNLKAYIAGGLVEDERELPSVTNITADASAIDVFPNEPPIIIPFTQNKIKYSSNANGKLFLQNSLLPISLDGSGGSPVFYKLHGDYEMELILHATKFTNFSIVGVAVNAMHGDVHFPNDGLGNPIADIQYTGSNIVWPYNGDSRKLKLKFNPLDIFSDNLLFDVNKDELIALQFKFIVDYLPTPETENLKGPVNRVIFSAPSYSFADSLTMNYPIHKIPVPFYSQPNATFGRKEMANFVNYLVNSDFNTTTSSSLFKYNDGSLPYGGRMSAHSKSHMDGRHIDIRYPHALNNTWDQAVNPMILQPVPAPNSSFDRKLCSSGYGVYSEQSKRLHHGYKKYLAIKNYLWIKRLVAQIHEDYKDTYPDVEMRSHTPQNETHNGDLIAYVALTICDAESFMSDPILTGLCNDLSQVYNSTNLEEIDDFISYVSETRDNIEEIVSISDGEKSDISQILISDGAGISSCFPKESSLYSFSYSNDWHKKIYNDGLLPDGASAGIGAWGISKPDSVIFQKNDFEHLSHLHIRVE